MATFTQSNLKKRKVSSMSKKRSVYYGWYVLAAAFLIASLGYSARYSFSVFYPEILADFGWSRAETAMALSFNLLIYGICSPVVGTLVDRYGAHRILISGAFILAAGLCATSQMKSLWLFYFLFGVIVPMGINALGFAVHNAYLPSLFPKRRGLAFGILNSADSAAYFFVLLYQFLILSLGWQTTYVVVGAGIFAIVISLTLLFMRRLPRGMTPPTEGSSTRGIAESASSKKEPDLPASDRYSSQQGWTLAKALKTSHLWFFFLTLVCISANLNLVLAHQPIYCQDIGFSAMFAASIFGLLGIPKIIGNLGGFVSDRIGREITFTLGTIGVLLGICALMLATISSPWLLYVYLVMFGVGHGLIAPTFFSSVADMFAGNRFGTINGFVLLGFGVGGALGPWIGGRVFDMMDSYRVAFIIAAVIMVAGCVFLWLAGPRKVKYLVKKVV